MREPRDGPPRLLRVAVFGALLAGVTVAVPLGPPINDVQVAAYERQDSFGVPGSCGFGAINQTSWPFGALISVQSNNSVVKGMPYGGCGSCFKITCADPECRSNSLPVTGLIIDSCPVCTAHLNLVDIPITRFVSLSNDPAATVNATVQQVDCQPPGNIMVRILNNPQISLLLELVLLNVRGSGAIRAVDLKNSIQDDSAWVPMEVYSGAIWQAGNLPPVPFDLRITDAEGEVLIARSFYTGGPGGDEPTSVQFQGARRDITVPDQAPISQEAAVLGGAAANPALSPTGAANLAPALPSATPSLAPGTPVLSPADSSGLAPVLAPTPLNASPAMTLPKCPGAVGIPEIAPATIPPNQPCRTILEVLEGSPSLSKWLKLLKDRGLTDALGNSNQQLTMFAPVNSSFSCNVFAGSDALAATIDQIAGVTQNSVGAIIGGQVVPGYYPASRLQSGSSLNTTDQIQQNGQTTYISVQVAPASVNGPIQVQGVGSVAKILQQDVEACGPSVVHVTDNFLLPFAPTPADSVSNQNSPVARAAEGPPTIMVDFPDSPGR